MRPPYQRNFIWTPKDQRLLVDSIYKGYPLPNFFILKNEDGKYEMVDEAHQLLKKDFNSFRSIISEGRMFGVGMILSTQNVSDFRTSKEDYSQFILSWVIHHVNSISKSEIANIFGASDPNSDRYMDFINKAKLFESVCKIGARVEGIRDLPFFELVQTDKRF